MKTKLLILATLATLTAGQALAQQAPNGAQSQSAPQAAQQGTDKPGDHAY